MEANKSGVDAAHAGPWKPEVVVGTSIGAVNGAAIAQGLSAEDLVEVWKNLEEKDIQGIPPHMHGLARWIVTKLFGQVMDASLPQVLDEPTSPVPEDFWPPLPLLPRWLADRIIGRWINLLDTGPLKKTLHSRFQFDPKKLAASETALLISATKIKTGERVLFSNRDVFDYKRGRARPDVFKDITAERILASCSIPLIYPWTEDKPTRSLYWDGALVANTPLGAALDLMGDDVNIPAEIVIVMMTPWWETGEPAPESARDKPKSFGDAITWMLDWMLLASFRENLKMIRAFNELAERERKEGKLPYRYRLVTPIIVAPKDFMEVERIIDYDGDVSDKLISDGHVAAKERFEALFKA
jgi:NTE family protein